jgi:hypothetical protein
MHIDATFSARRADEQLADDASRIDPRNPFLDAAYLRAQQALGIECWLLGVESAGRMQAAALGLIRRGRLFTTLDIPSTPGVDAESVFWSGLDAFCRDERVTNLELSTFASPSVSIPVLRGEEARTSRTEYQLGLIGRDVFAGLSTHHRGRVKKGRARGLAVHRSVSGEAFDAHLALHSNSMARRKERHEEVPLEESSADEAALLANHAAELYQAMSGEDTASSLLIMKSSRGAYFKSAGTSPEGMRVGASHFLVLETALALQSEGFEVFHLGGVRQEEEGLRAFKAGFGATPIEGEAVVAYVGGRLRRRVSAAVETIQRAITPRSSAMVGDTSESD